MVPALDAFLELGEGFNSLMDNLYMNENQNKNHNKNSGGGGNDHNNVQVTAKKRTITTICVPGAGFSGFWYSFGRLHALEHDIGNRTSTSTSTLHSVKGAGGIDVKNQTNEATTATSIATATIANYEYEYGYHNYLHGYEYDYECFSAGCLVVVATLMKYSMEEVLEKASDAQNEYIAGNIRRYDVVEHFVDSLLGIPLSENEHEHEHEHEVLTKEALSRIQIITTGLNHNLRDFDYDPNHAYFKHYSRSPADIRELKEYLIQTTWM